MNLLSYIKTRFVVFILIIFSIILLIPPVASAIEPIPNTEGQAIDSQDLIVESHAEAENSHQEEASSGIVGMFGLNWKLFLAQLINFGIVLFVLWKWVFGPVTKGLSERASKIESSLANAERIEQDRGDFNTWKEAEISKVRSEAAAILTQSKKDSETLKESILQTTKEEQEKLKIQAIKTIELEKVKAISEVQTYLADLVISASEKILQEKLDPKKNSQLVTEAIHSVKDSHK